MGDSVGERMSEPTRKRWQDKRKRNGERFLRGPVPLVWLTQAARLTGKALTVGMAVWYLRGMRNADPVSLTPATWEQFGLDRFAVWRGLKQLEAAGLVTVERHRGRCPLVTIRGVRRKGRHES